jgi:hypothetical protein
MYESASERWSPIQSVEKILISVMSMLAEPNDESGANVDASVCLPVPFGGHGILTTENVAREPSRVQSNCTKTGSRDLGTIVVAREVAPLLYICLDLVIHFLHLPSALDINPAEDRQVETVSQSARSWDL